MFLGLQLIIIFTVGLPVSFGIGSLIAYLINVFTKNSKQVWLGGILYIIAQPIALILVVVLKISKVGEQLGFKTISETISLFESLFAVSFAIIFTATIYYLIRKLKRRNLQTLEHH